MLFVLLNCTKEVQENKNKRHTCLLHEGRINMAVYKVLGKKKAVTLKGSDFFTYYFERPFTEYECEKSECLGNAVEIENTFTDLDVKPGDLVELVYSKGFQDKANLSGVHIVKPAIK